MVYTESSNSKFALNGGGNECARTNTHLVLLSDVNKRADIGFIQVKEEDWTVFSEEKPCQPEEKPILPNSFTHIYILFQIGFITFQKSNKMPTIFFFAGLI